jgi:hypothetical protein
VSLAACHAPAQPGGRLRPLASQGRCSQPGAHATVRGWPVPGERVGAPSGGQGHPGPGQHGGPPAGCAGGPPCW